MNYQPGDIVVRKRGDRQTVWVSQRLVMDTCDLAEEYLRCVVRSRYKASVQPCHRHHPVLPDTGKAWRWARINGSFYYDLSRLPNRSGYRDRFGDAETLVNHYQATLEAAQHRTFEKDLTTFIKARYPHYLKEYTECTEVQQAALAKACAVLDFTAERLAAGSDKPCRVYSAVCTAAARTDLRYVPRNARVLKQKVQRITQEEQPASRVVRLPRAGNANALRFSDPAIKACAIKMRAMP